MYTIKECIKKYREVCTRTDLKGTDIIRYSKLYKNKKLVIAFANPIIGKGWEIHIVSNGAVDAKQAKRLEAKVRRHICTRIIPHGGRSVLRVTISRFGTLCTHRKGRDDIFINVPVTCTEIRPNGDICHGQFKPVPLGEYICDQCGIIHEYADYNNAEEDTFDEEEEEDRGDESNYFDVLQTSDRGVMDTTNYIAQSYEWAPPNKAHSTLGGKSLDGYYNEVEKRCAKSILEWKKSLDIIPQDEINARNKAHNSKIRHDECVKLNKKYPRSKQEETYLAKWRNAQRKSRLSKLISLVRLGVSDTADLLAKMDTSNDTFYLDLGILLSRGRVTSNKMGRRNNIEFVYPLIPLRVLNNYPSKVKFDREPPKKTREEKPSVYTKAWWDFYKTKNSVHMY